MTRTHEKLRPSPDGKGANLTPTSAAQGVEDALWNASKSPLLGVLQNAVLGITQSSATSCLISRTHWDSGD